MHDIFPFKIFRKLGKIKYYYENFVNREYIQCTNYHQTFQSFTLSKMLKTQFLIHVLHVFIPTPTLPTVPFFIPFTNVLQILTTGPDISEGSIFLVCSSAPLSVMDLVRFTEEEGRGGARDFLLPPSLRKLLRLAARGSSIFSGVGVSITASFFSSFGSDKM